MKDRQMAKLTAKAIDNLKPKEKQYKVFDGDGLHLLIKPNGSKLWRYNYTHNGKAKTLSYGQYPLIPLSEARIKHTEAKHAMMNNIDPLERKQKEQKATKQAGVLFGEVFKQWHKHQSLTVWKANTARNCQLKANKYLTILNNTPLIELDKKTIWQVLTPLIDENKAREAKAVCMIISAVFEFASIRELIPEDRANPAKRIIPQIKMPAIEHHAYITPDELPQFFAKFKAEKGNPIIKIYILLLMLLFTRERELRRAKWADIDYKNKVLIIPPENRKLRKLAKQEPHIIFLSGWVMELLAELKQHTLDSPYLFPSFDVRTKTGYIPLQGIRLYLKKCTDKTLHGMRSLASTYLNGQGFSHDAIERQLAHIEPNAVRASYNHDKKEKERAEMMQAYSDYIQSIYDTCK